MLNSRQHKCGLLCSLNKVDYHLLSLSTMVVILRLRLGHQPCEEVELEGWQVCGIGVSETSACSPTPIPQPRLAMGTIFVAPSLPGQASRRIHVTRSKVVLLYVSEKQEDTEINLHQEGNAVPAIATFLTPRESTRAPRCFLWNYSTKAIPVACAHSDAAG